MDNIILYDGLYQAEVNEFAYAEAELVVASNYIDNLFFDLVRGFNDDAVLYGESDDDGAKQGFFKRIWAMFKKFWKAIIDFIKNVCRKVLEILAKPFGFKMNKANNSGGAGSGGGSSTRSDGSSNSSNVGTGNSDSWSSLKELTLLMNKTISYIKTVKSVTKDDVSKEGIVDTDLMKDSINTITEYTKYRKVNITEPMKTIASLVKRLKLFDDKDLLESLDNSHANIAGSDLTDMFENARAHKSMSFKFEVIKFGANKDDDMKRLIALMDASYRVIKNIMMCSGKTAAAMGDIEKKTNDAEALATCKELLDSIIADCNSKSFHSIHNSVLSYVNDEDKIFGIKSMDAVALSPVFYLYSFGKSNLHAIINEKDFLDEINGLAVVKSATDFKADAYDANMNILKGEMLSNGVHNLGLINVDVRPGDKISDLKFFGESKKGKTMANKPFTATETYSEIVKSVLRENLKDMTQMKEEYELNDAKKNTLKDLKDAKKVSSNTAIQSLVSNASAILKSTVKNMTNLTNLTVRVDNACISVPYIYQSLQLANAIHIYWDRVCYARAFLLKEIENNKKLREDLGNPDEYKSELEEDFKSFQSVLSITLRQKYGD